MANRIKIGEYEAHITPMHVTIYGPDDRAVWHVSLHRKKIKSKKPIRLESNAGLYKSSQMAAYRKTYFTSIESVRAKIKEQGLEVPMEVFDAMNANLMMREMTKDG